MSTRGETMASSTFSSKSIPHAGLPTTAAGASTSRCQLCGKVEDLRRCARCTTVWYCSKEHQRQDWNSHKGYCKKLPPPKTEANQQAISGQGSSVTAKSRPHVLPSHPPPANSDKVISNPSNPNTRELGGAVLKDAEGAPYRPRTFPKPPAYDTRSIAAHVFKHLMRDGYCVIDDLREVEFARNLAEEVKTLYQSGKFVDGQLGGGKTSSDAAQKLVEKNIRGDKIVMVDGSEPFLPSIGKLNVYLTNVVQGLNHYLEGQYVISGRTKIMVACYPGDGTGYARHVDNPNRDGRCITCLYYLNEGWDVTEQGGLLRLYPDASTGYVDIEPILNRVLFFWSDRRSPHEVQPAYDSRYAITIWYLDKKERLEAKEAQTKQEIDKTAVGLAMKNLQLKEAEKNEILVKKADLSRQAADTLTDKELEDIAAGLREAASPHAYLTSVGISDSIQAEVMRKMQETRETIKP